MAPRRIITLPPTLTGAEAVAFARDGLRRGADVIEARTDLHAPGDLDVEALARVMPLLVSERGKPLPAPWVQAAWRVDRDVERARTWMRRRAGCSRRTTRKGRSRRRRRCGAGLARYRRTRW